MGAAWGGKNRVTTTWYNGNGDSASQQTLGPTEVPSKWNGDWRRTLLGASDQAVLTVNGIDTVIVDPSDLRDTLEDIFRTGLRLRVVWSVYKLVGINGTTTQESGGPIRETFSNVRLDKKIVREGRATEWEFKHTRAEDIEWDVTFDWASRGGATVAPLTSTRSDTVATSTGALESAVSALKNAQALSQLTPASHLTLGQLQAFANAPTVLVKGLTRQITQIEHQVGQIVDIAKTLADQPTQIANLAANLATNTLAIANDNIKKIANIPVEYQTTGRKVSDALKAYKQNRQVTDLTEKIASSAQAFAVAVRRTRFNSGGGVLPNSSTSDQIQRVYITRDGDTPQRISQNFYKTPDHGVDILKANRLPWHTATFTKGKILIIPVLSSVTSGA